ncbi:MAG: Dot/Icm secretion system protein IcmQ [Legionellaceae bacterium]|nr:Dot/Icm secretion system protein IcmQ [Legionellaceae bacterium]
MTKNKLSEQQIKALLGAFQDTIEHGPWASSALLRVLGKKLQSIYDGFETDVGLDKQAVAKKESEHHSQKKPSDSQQEVFVALYSSDGANLKSWEQILINLPRQMVSRPIYEKEEEIKQAIRSRENPVNEGYVVIYINRSNVLSMPIDRTPKDRLGTPLLTLKDKSLSLDYIVRFMHVSGVYTYTRGRLIKDLPMNTES